MNATVAWARAHEVITNSDTTEGRSHNVTIGVFTDRSKALEAAQGEGVMGTDADVKSYDALVVQWRLSNGTAGYSLLGKDLNPPTKRDIAAIKNRAMSKLTEEEKRALGLI